MGAKVLVVEDDNFLVSAYRAKLTKAGFTVEIATDGEEALAKLPAFGPDLIILDVVMPRKDGFTTLQEIKQMEAYRHIPVIIATNLGQKDEVERANELGAVDFITKSNLSMNELVEKINNFLK
jgi:two-component system phosphate regulon response regulator PhoB/two-component system alkaline phosphatase synthesis response regulator PhoP